MAFGPRAIRKQALPDKMILYEMEEPHPPEIPAFERKVLSFYAMEPRGGINAETIPLMILPINVYGPDGFVRSLFSFLASRMNALLFTVEYLGTKTINRNSSWVDHWVWDESTHLRTNEYLGLGGYPALSQKFESVAQVLNHLGRVSSQRRPDQEPPILATYVREPDDHYDSGLVQVMDCLWAVQVLRSEYPTINWSALATIGTSRGGYLSTQCSRLAPNTFALAVNGFGPTKPRLDFIRKCDYHHVYPHAQSNTIFAIGMDSYWSEDPASPFFFSPDRSQIRTLDDPKLLTQWCQQIRGSGPLHIFYQPVDDEDHPAVYTTDFVRQLRQVGMDVSYAEQQTHQELKENSIDGFSLAGFVLENITKDNVEKYPVARSDFDLKSQIVYRCDQGTEYRIDFREAFPRLEITGREASTILPARQAKGPVDPLKEI